MAVNLCSYFQSLKSGKCQNLLPSPTKRNLFWNAPWMRSPFLQLSGGKVRSYQQGMHFIFASILLLLHHKWMTSGSIRPLKNLKTKRLCCENIVVIFSFCHYPYNRKASYPSDSVPITELKVNDTRYSFAANSNNVSNTKLIISKVDSNDRGNYTCNITTLTGSFEVFTFVRVKGKKKIVMMLSFLECLIVR